MDVRCCSCKNLIFPSTENVYVCSSCVKLKTTTSVPLFSATCAITTSSYITRISETSTHLSLLCFFCYIRFCSYENKNDQKCPKCPNLQCQEKKIFEKISEKLKYQLCVRILVACIKCQFCQKIFNITNFGNHLPNCDYFKKEIKKEKLTSQEAFNFYLKKINNINNEKKTSNFFDTNPPDLEEEFDLDDLDDDDDDDDIHIIHHYNTDLKPNLKSDKIPSNKNLTAEDDIIHIQCLRCDKMIPSDKIDLHEKFFCQGPIEKKCLTCEKQIDILTFSKHQCPEEKVKCDKCNLLFFKKRYNQT